MRRSSNAIMLSIIILLFVVSFNAPINEYRSNLQHETTQTQRDSVLSLTPSGPITITSNSDFSSQGWPGSGIEGDPYRIEDLEFSSPDTSISIRNTDVYFMISGCSFTGISQNQGRAIDLAYVSNGTVNTCFFYNIQFGVWIEYSDNLTIVDNDADYVGYGAFCKYSNNLTISRNTVIDARDEGIGTYFCDDCVIHGNSVTNCGDHGFWLYETYNSFLTNNTVTHCGYRALVEEWYPNSAGVRVGNCFNNTIVGNNITDSKELGMDLNGNSHTLIDNHFSANGPWGDIAYWNGNDGTFINNTFEQGILMHISTAKKMEGNTVAGKPIAYFDSLSSTSINISTYGQVILDNCNNVEVYSGVFTDVILGIHFYQSIDCRVNQVNISGARYGVQLRDSSDCVFNATTITNSVSHGLTNYQSDGTSIFNSTITESGGAGVRLERSDNCNITSNRFIDNVEGGLYVYDSWYTYLRDNSFYGDGLVVTSQDTFGYNLTVINNTVNEKPLGYFYDENGGSVADIEFGQLLVAVCDQFIIDNCNVTNASNGVIIARSTDCTIQNSKLSMNTLRGVWDFFSTGTTISNCIISENGDVGIEVTETEFTSIEGNLIINNQGDGIEIWAGDYLSLEDNQIIGNQGHGFICDWPHTWTVYRNNISYNGDDGIVLWHGWNVDVQNNIVTNNDGDGFFLDESEYCTFTGNFLMDNTDYGFYLNSQCDSNTFYNNTMGDLCRDDGTNDLWDNGVNLGNIWDDYNGIGNYFVPGSGGGVDHYPRILDFDDPVISSPIDFTVEQWSLGSFIQTRLQPTIQSIAIQQYTILLKKLHRH